MAALLAEYYLYRAHGSATAHCWRDDCVQATPSPRLPARGISPVYYLPSATRIGSIADTASNGAAPPLQPSMPYSTIAFVLSAMPSCHHFTTLIMRLRGTPQVLFYRARYLCGLISFIISSAALIFCDMMLAYDGAIAGVISALPAINNGRPMRHILISGRLHGHIGIIAMRGSYCRPIEDFYVLSLLDFFYDFMRRYILQRRLAASL